MPSPRNPEQKKTRVVIKRQMVGDEVHILCRSDARVEKDRAIRDTHEQRLLAAAPHATSSLSRELQAP